MELTDPTAVALEIAEVLQREAIDHALCGGLLLAAYGEARETKDADLAVVRGDASRASSLLETHLGLHCRVAFDQRSFGGLSVSRITLIEGDELNTLDLMEPVFKLLSTRELDLEDATSVMRGLASDLDRDLLEREIGALAACIESHPVRDRWDRVRSPA